MPKPDHENKPEPEELFDVALMVVKRKDGRTFYVGGEHKDVDYTGLVALQIIAHKNINEPLTKVGASRCDPVKLAAMLEAAGVAAPS